jgi:hypothetical protein
MCSNVVDSLGADVPPDVRIALSVVGANDGFDVSLRAGRAVQLDSDRLLWRVRSRWKSENCIGDAPGALPRPCPLFGMALCPALPFRRENRSRVCCKQLLGQVHDAERMVDLSKDETGWSKSRWADVCQAGTMSRHPDH